jgi:hypothetical protein
VNCQQFAKKRKKGRMPTAERGKLTNSSRISSFKSQISGFRPQISNFESESSNLK